MKNQQILVQLNSQGKGKLKLVIDNNEVGLMDISVQNNLLTVYHTEVHKEFEGQGYGKKLFDTLIEYAQTSNLKVKPLCTFVMAMFKKNKENLATLLA